MALVCRSRPALKDYDASSAREALSRLLAPEYVNLAFSLPPTSNTIWSFLDEDIERMGSSNPFPSSTEELLEFLSMFFSKDVIEQVAENLSMLESSFLGGGYALRRGKVVLARTIVDDILRSHVNASGGELHGFLGEVEGSGEPVDGGVGEWKTVQRKNSGPARQGGNRSRPGGTSSAGGLGRGAASSAGGLGRGATSSAGGLGRGGGRGGGRRGNVLPPRLDYDAAGAPFRRMLKVLVPLPAWRTPPKGAKARRETLAARSFQFKCHGGVSEDSTALYDPRMPTGRVNLFHGMRRSSLDALHNWGIDPPLRRNEFCAGAAFYVTNSVQHAVEHPLHNHPGQPMHEDFPAVLVFNVDVEVLHGEKAYPGGDRFLVHWFVDVEDRQSYEQWLEFCIGNLQGELRKEDFDIVIGPACLPLGAGATKLEADLGGGVQLTQIALCSQRAREWLASCVTKVYCEERPL